MKVKDLVSEINDLYPESLQENYDNTGPQIVFPDAQISNVYISLDIEKNVIDDAVKNGCNMIICHHPLIFRPVKRIISAEARSSMIIDLIKNGISLYAMHTNFDKFMFDFLAVKLGFSDSRLLIKTDSIGERTIGFGSITDIENGMLFSDLLENVKRSLDTDYLLYSGEHGREIKSIAFINGAGGGSFERVISGEKPDCIITGDVGYHNFRFASDSGTAVIDAGHFGTEIIFKKMLAQTVTDIINAYGEKIQVIISEIEKNPMRLYI